MCCGCHLVSGNNSQNERFDCCFDFSHYYYFEFIVRSNNFVELNGNSFRFAFQPFLVCVCVCTAVCTAVLEFYVAKVFNPGKCNARISQSIFFLLAFFHFTFEILLILQFYDGERERIKSADETKDAGTEVEGDRGREKTAHNKR